ncbi:MAG: hypothetical protein R2909_13170 [Gemmatimonadales bacterium]
MGKTTAARILAMALNCERGDAACAAASPVASARTCERTWGGLAGLDVVEIDAASNRSGRRRPRAPGERDVRRVRRAAPQGLVVDEAHADP